MNLSSLAFRCRLSQTFACLSLAGMLVLMTSCGKAGRSAESKADASETLTLGSEFKLSLKIPFFSSKSEDLEVPAVPDPDGWHEQPFITAQAEPASTFAIDVDKAGYSFVRNAIESGQLPNPSSVRIEELVNYFTYSSYPPPAGNQPFAIHSEMSDCPWNEDHRLMMVALRSKNVDTELIPPCNLVFLVDVSGSMGAPNRLPLVKSSLRKLTERLRPEDKVSLVTYAGSTEVVLTPTSEHQKILSAIDALGSGGATAGAAGLTLAYEQAQAAFLKNGNNRILLATDGDFNVGISSDEELVKLIEEKKKTGIYLSVLGFGMNGASDVKMEKLTNAGNGFYAYLDSEEEADKTLIRELSGTLMTVATDVKIQTVFDPEVVESYRLIGYDNRRLAKQDFDNDTKDAGDLGAGHFVTAMYEVKLRKKVAKGTQLAVVRSRYKPKADAPSLLSEQPIYDNQVPFPNTSSDFRFASAVTAYGLILRQSEFKGSAHWDWVEQTASQTLGADLNGDRKGFLALVQQARRLSVQ